MNSFSTTQAANIASIAAVVVLIAKHFKFDIRAEDLVSLISSVIAVIGIIVSYYKRYQQGDLHVTGFRKPNPNNES